MRCGKTRVQYILMKKHTEIRVAQFCPYYPPHIWWLENYLYQWSKTWRSIHKTDSLLNIIFITNPEQYTLIHDEYWLAIPSFEIVSNFPFPKFWKKEFWKSIGKIKKFNPTIIQTHTRFFLSSALGGILAKYTWAHWVHTEHGSDYVVSNQWLVQKIAYIYDQTIGKWTLQYANKIISISQATAHFVLNLSGKSSEVISPGVTYFEPESATLPIIHAWKTRIIFAGRIVKLKWYHILVKSLEKFFIKNPKFLNQIELHVYGDGPEKDSFQSMTEHLWILVRFHGNVPHEVLVSQILPMGDILMVPSLQEWFWLVVIEWLLAKMVVIASNTWGIAEMGCRPDLFLCPVEDIKAFTEALEISVESLSKIRWSSFESLKNKYNWNTIIELYQRIYQQN